MTEPASRFSFSYYRQMLRTLSERGYAVSSFKNFDATKKKTMILRHDVDYTLDGVLDIAKIEAENKMTATYLFRVHADEYNLFACTTYRLIEELKSLGHEIGLHFEAMNVGRALQIEPQDLMRREKVILETVMNDTVLTCSEHRDFSNMVHQTPNYEKQYDPYKAGFKFFAMDPKYAKEMKYLSDSNANWREGDPLEHIDRHDRLQVLIHPDWWFENDLLLKGRYYHSRRADG